MNFDLVQIEHWEDSTDFLEQLSRKTGRLLKVQNTSAVCTCTCIVTFTQLVGLVLMYIHVHVYEFVMCII